VDQAVFIAVLKPVSDLLDGCLLQIVGKGGCPAVAVVPGMT
jgi:hypothetical protein